MLIFAAMLAWVGWVAGFFWLLMALIVHAVVCWLSIRYRFHFLRDALLLSHRWFEEHPRLGSFLGVIVHPPSTQFYCPHPTEQITWFRWSMRARPDLQSTVGLAVTRLE